MKWTPERIGTKTRWALAGFAQADVIIENVNGLYLRDNALEYLNSMLPPLIEEFERRKKEYPGVLADRERKRREKNS